MGGETEQNISGWTTDTLKEYISNHVANIRHFSDERDRRYGERFEAQEKATTAALVAAKEAVLKAEAASERRFEGVNEFRQTLADQARELMPRLETEQRLAALGSVLSGLTERLNRMEGEGSATLRQSEWQHSLKLAAPGYVFGAVGTLLGLVGFIYALVK